MSVASPALREPAAVWFSRLVWIGIVCNILSALPAVFDPAGAPAFMGFPPATPQVWLRFSGHLVILLSLLYVPAAIDPYRYRMTAWLLVICRLGGVLFFGSVTLFTSERQYWLFGLYDLIFLVPQAILLSRMSDRNPADPHFR